MKKYSVIGLMSGTSLDGLDIVCCDFQEQNGKWSFQVRQAETLTYAEEWQNKLLRAPFLNEKKLKEINTFYGEYLAKTTLSFIEKHELKPDFVASHGHTIFHQPQNNYTLQIGDGEVMAKILNLPVVFDFRSNDVSISGQGAPLVPMGDKLLFSEFEYCLNLGGIANISYEKDGIRLAYDICPVNMALNNISQKLGIKFDKGGQLASKGKLNVQLLSELNNIPFYQLEAPKSLSREWFESDFSSVISESEIPKNDLLHTLTEHIAFQISNSFIQIKNANVLITGGGAHNAYLIKQIKSLSGIQIIIPENELVEFKEAIIFALLGILRMRNEVNCLSAVTGASRDSSGGKIAYP